MSKIRELQDVMEMANLDKKTHKLNIDVKLNVLQPGKKLKHGPRVKVFRGSLKNKNKKEFVLSIEQYPKLLAGDIFVNRKEYQLIRDFVSDNYEALLQFWNDSDMSVGELEDLLK